MRCGLRNPTLVFILIGALGFPLLVLGESAEPDRRAEDEFDIMNVLSHEGLHDLDDEWWNAYGQTTYIYQWKPSFPAAYTDLHGSPNSLSPLPQTSFTATMTGYFGLKLWEGGELYAAPEIISENPLSGLHGLGSTIQNFELQKSGTSQPILYLSRVYYRQTFDLGGGVLPIESDPLQLGTQVDRNRLVFNLGNYSVLDIFDKNSFSGDLRRQFMNMAFLSYAAYDFGADARGYSWGATVQYLHQDWAFRAGRVIAPYHPNQLTLNWNILDFYSDSYEIEHAHTLLGQPGVIRLLGFRNRENMGSFQDAIDLFRLNPAKYNATSCTSWNYENPNPNAPDLCWVRKPNIKIGIGINLEQQVADGVGVFLRGMWNDGNTEVYSYTSTDRSLSTGVLVNGWHWSRERDLAGIGYGQGWISRSHATYLGLGGIDGFIGDGAITWRSEHVMDAFYSMNVLNPVWITADYQFIANPAYNAARGPVDVFTLRFHAEF